MPQKYNPKKHKSIKNTWVIGDVHGCDKSLKALLAHPELQDDDCKLWFVGDLINRGPGSLQVLETIMSLGDKAVAILGNHDIHALAVYAGFREQQNKDTLSDILESPDAELYFDWLRKLPLAHLEAGHLMVHAGVMQSWTAKQTVELAQEISDKLSGKKWKKHLEKIFGNAPNSWSDDLSKKERRLVAINALTRMRMCYADGSMEFDCKGKPDKNDDSLTPWFDLPDRAAADHTIIFGHWSALGLMVTPNVIALDTGCVWGGHLTAMRLSDRRLIQIPAQE